MSGRTGRAIIYPWGLMEPGDSFVADTLKNGIVRRNRTALTRRYGRFFVERDLPGLGVTRVWCAAYVPGASPYRDPNNRLQLCTVVEKGDPVPADLMAGVTEMMRRGVITMPRAKYDWAGLKVGGSIRMAASAGGVRSRLSELSLRYGKLFTVRPCEDGAGCIVWCVGKVGEAPTIDVPVVRRGRRTKVEMDPGLLGYAQQLGALKPGEVVSLTGTWERISLARKHVVKKTNYLFSSTTKSFHKRTGSVRVTRVE